MTVLVLAEHNGQQLHPATHHAVCAGVGLGSVHVLVVGEQGLAQQAALIEGVTQVIHVEAPHYAPQLAEDMAALLASLVQPYRYLLAAADVFGKNIMPRVAALLDVPQISDVVSMVDANTFVTPMYAGNVLATVQCDEPRLVLTVRTSAFDAAETQQVAAPVVTAEALPPQNLSRLLERELITLERPELTQAPVVVAGGRALGSAEQFDAVLTPLADVLGAAIGASRAAVDADFAPNDYQVGQTGKIVAPRLYVAVGISGAIQHIAGMQGSQTIVAINKDPDAPIFNVADVGMVGDLFEIVPQLTAALQQR